MHLRLVALAAAAALLLSLAFSLWRGGSLRDWLRPTPGKAPEIVFDNGSVRDLPQHAASQPSRVAALSPPGVLRKCVRGDQVTYSNLTCPPGFRERTVSQAGVTVVPAVRRAGQESGPPSAKPHEAMREALDMKRDDRLRQRMIDRAIEAEAK